MFAAIACVIWDFCIFALVRRAFEDGTHLPGALGYVALSVLLTYCALAAVLNRTTIRAQAGILRVSEGPLPWTLAKTISTKDIHQLYCKRVETRGRRGTGTVISYDVLVLLANGTSTQLVKHLEEPEQALFIEQAIEERLGIVDEPALSSSVATT